MRPTTKNFIMAAGPKAGLYQNANSATYLPSTLSTRFCMILKPNVP